LQKLNVLKKQFGFDSFKPIQEEAINKILNHEDILVILPTGSGKSLIYQLPTLLMDGVTVVISPLIALMQDQVANLKINGIKSAMINSQNSHEENFAIFNLALEKKIQFLYIAPERIANEQFQMLLKKLDINYFVIDEAHCVSEWGHEFRDDYRKLAYLKDIFPSIPISAFTATATKEVQSDILQTLKIPNNSILKAKIQRENLFISCKKRVGNGKKQIVNFLNQHKDECGIVYCFSRKECESMSDFLNLSGFNTQAYHAGLPTNKRDEIFKKFKDESIKIVVATIAFGMGIDKSNIRFVLHTSMPKTIENYTQEIGRAGRDGIESYAMLLYSKSDEISKRRFVDELPNSPYKQNSYEKLAKMYRFASSENCRHQLIATYFNDEVKKCETKCDNCTNTNRIYKDITVESQKFLSTIVRTGSRFGQSYIIDVLKGSTAKRVLDFSHDKLSVYSIGSELSRDAWSVICDKLLDIEAISIDGEYRVLKLKPLAKEILKGNLKVEIDEENLKVKKEKAPKRDEPLTPDMEKFNHLREIRRELAKSEGVPPYIIFSDKSLKEMAAYLPKTKAEFMAINGVGEMKLEKYGEIFINACKELFDKNIK